jgi:hypothetical protein
VDQGGQGQGTGVPRSSWLRKPGAERPSCRQVRHIDISTACAHAPGQVRLPPQTLRRRTPKRIANSARQLVACTLGFHIYTLEWEPGRIRWYADGRLYSTQSFWWSSGKTDGAKGANPTGEADLNPWPAPFDQPFYLVMNVAVGGKFLGNPDKTTMFRVEMVVDYVRVYDKVGGYGTTKPRGEGRLPFGKR